MKEIKEEVTITKTKIKFKAVDGTMFEDPNECIKYENTAKCALMIKYNKYLINSDTEYTIFGAGSDDVVIDIVQIKDADIIDYIIQLWVLHRSNVSKEDYKYLLDKMVASLEEARKNKDYFFIYRGYSNEDHDFCPQKSFTEHFTQITSMCNPKKDK